jgi:hypothetical protein
MQVPLLTEVGRSFLRRRREPKFLAGHRESRTALGVVQCSFWFLWNFRSKCNLPLDDLRKFFTTRLFSSTAHELTSGLSISFILCLEHGLTRQLHSCLIHSSINPVSRPLRAILEVPDGTATKTAIRDTDTIIAIAGGIGITSIPGYLQDYLSSLENDRRGKVSKFLPFWSAKEETLITVVKL